MEQEKKNDEKFLCTKCGSEMKRSLIFHKRIMCTPECGFYFEED
jgi:hypothetical protein